jgi:translation initiation factor RLI1
MINNFEGTKCILTGFLDNFNCLRYVIVVEHDLSVLDYLSDFICVLYGVPGVYGVVTMPFSVREGTREWYKKPAEIRLYP